MVVMRTTVDIDTPILKELKRLAKREGKSMGRLMSDLLARALRRRGEMTPDVDGFQWVSREMGARYDLDDHDAILDALDESPPAPEKPRP